MSHTHSSILPEVLVVDDEPVSRDMLILMLQASDVRAEAACDGQHATELISRRPNHPFEIVFTDVQMPRMDGLALLEWLNQHSPATATVIMTANQERDLVSASLRGGAIEFLDKPFDPRAVLRAARRARENHRQRAQQLEAARRLLDIAEINQRLTRTALASAGHDTARLTLTTRFYAMNEAGGDLVKASATDPDHLLLVLGDVSGHGLKEGFLSAYFQGIIEGMARHAADSRQIAEAFNRFLIDQWNDAGQLAVQTSLSACFVQLDLQTHQVSILNCGSPGVMLADHLGNVSTHAPGGTPLGWFETIEIAQATTPVPLCGQLWLWSDGLEAHAALLRIPPLALAHRLLAAAPNTLSSTLLKDADDDIVACRLAWTPPPGTPAPSELWLPLHHQTHPGDSLSRIDTLHADWTRLLRLSIPLLGETSLHDIPLCIREAAINAFQHGCKHSPDRSCRIEILLDPTLQRLLVRLTDDGLGFDPASPRPPEDPNHISLGIQLIRSLTLSCHHSPDGRSIEMIFQIPATP